MDASAFIFALAVSIVTGIVFGSTPLLSGDGSLRSRMGRRPRARGALVVAGAALGLVGGFGVSRFVASLLEGAHNVDAPVLMVSAGLLAIVAVVACFVPARRAIRIQATAALRHE